MIKAVSARLRRVSSHSGKCVPERSLGTYRSIVPVRVSQGRDRYPLREFPDPGSAPRTPPHRSRRPAHPSAPQRTSAPSSAADQGWPAPTAHASNRTCQDSFQRSSRSSFERSIDRTSKGSRDDRPYVRTPRSTRADSYTTSMDATADLLRSCKRRGIRTAVLAVDDGALGFPAAARDVFP